MEPDEINHTLDRSFLDASVPSLVKQMTLEEKLSLLTADGWWHIKVTDGPGGARGGNAYKMTPAVSFPNATCIAATFDNKLVEDMGIVLAADTKARGCLCLLGPTLNIQRSPLGGRAFESFSEDPTLSGQITAAYVKGLQDNGVSATVKHFICNDQEHERIGQDSIVAPRALREVYLRPFQIAQNLSKPWAYMTSYNKLNGLHCSENGWLLKDLLRGEWKHDQLIMSDWFGTYSISEAINAGLNVEFPGPTRFRTPLIVSHLIGAHKIDERTIDELAIRVLSWVQMLTKQNKEFVYAKDKSEKTRWDDQPEDAKLVRRIANEGIVLLKNEEEILPVRKGKVAIIGPNFKAKVFTGGGSARLQPAWSSTPWQGFVSEKPESVDLSYELGISTAKFYPLLDDCFASQDGEVGFDVYHYPLTAGGLQAEEHLYHDHLYRSEIRFNNWSRPGIGDMWFTEVKSVFTAPITGEYEFAIIVTGKVWFWIENELRLEVTDYKVKGEGFYGNGIVEEKVRLNVEEGKKYNIRLLHDTRAPPNVVYLMSAAFRYPAIRIGAQPAYEPEQALSDAATLASKSDLAVVVCGLNQDWESEGDDRPTLTMPLRTDELIHKIADANPNTIVVIQGGSAVSMPWLHKVKAVVQAWYGGCETGTSIADIVYGHVNPSGRLPLTFPKSTLDSGAALSFKSANKKVYYEDGIWVGYKHFNARQIQPLFPFGHGLSYTTFDYSDLKTTSVSSPDTPAQEWKLTAQITVTNTGKVAGSHSVHFYTCPPPETATGLRHPEQALQAWGKVYNLSPGAKETVTVSMDKYAISHWDELFNIWRAEPGKWSIKIGKDAQTMYGDAGFEIGEEFKWTGL